MHSEIRILYWFTCLQGSFHLSMEEDLEFNLTKTAVVQPILIIEKCDFEGIQTNTCRIE